MKRAFQEHIKPIHLVAGAMICLILFAAYDWRKVNQKYRSQKKVPHLSKLDKLKTQKEAVLTRSFDFLLDFGEDHKRVGELKLAADRYFDAKSIYPYDVKPRYELIKVYYELAVIHSAYCYHAQKEINYAKRYITPEEHPSMYKDIIEKSNHLATFCKSVENYAFHYDQ